MELQSFFDQLGSDLFNSVGFTWDFQFVDDEKWLDLAWKKH